MVSLSTGLTDPHAPYVEHSTPRAESFIPNPLRSRSARGKAHRESAPSSAATAAPPPPSPRDPQSQRSRAGAGGSVRGSCRWRDGLPPHRSPRAPVCSPSCAPPGAASCRRRSMLQCSPRSPPARACRRPRFRRRPPWREGCPEVAAKDEGRRGGIWWCVCVCVCGRWEGDGNIEG